MVVCSPMSAQLKERPALLEWSLQASIDVVERQVDICLLLFGDSSYKINVPPPPRLLLQ